ncbi:transcriptional regulator [Winogradskyella sp. PC-19]|uniref:Fur family transcriptional regulator n=1 Tax=unclassified Winogradskyella TaxID=2615021 RepID=UPI000B3CAF7C|nr:MULTISPECIES: transcriptional repressor [unclassified Winogradskyella]ARV08429.1 transcriptional regulator [Winogradskyella sp. PC-19]
MGIIRKTKAVNTVLNIFEEKNEAKSVVSLIELVKGEMNKTTVYRILDRLEQDGIIHSFNGKDGLKWYAKCHGCSSHSHSDTHPHFQCTECDKVECLSLEVKIPTLKNHKVETTDILLRGQCESCSA